MSGRAPRRRRALLAASGTGAADVLSFTFEIGGADATYTLVEIHGGRNATLVRSTIDGQNPFINYTGGDRSGIVSADEIRRYADFLLQSYRVPEKFPARRRSTRASSTERS